MINASTEVLAKMLNDCYKKRDFSSKSEAKKWGKEWGQTPYTCPICKKIHLTSNKTYGKD